MHACLVKEIYRIPVQGDIKGGREGGREGYIYLLNNW